MFVDWILFLLLAIVIYFAGSRLTYYADVLGEKWGVERTFIGLILLSLVTSLPELGTSLSSITWVNSPDLALGNVLGSNLLNLAIIPLLALLYRRTFLYRANIQNNINASLITIIYALAGFGIISHLRIFPAWMEFDFIVSPFSLLIFIFYLGGLYFIFLDRDISGGTEKLAEEKIYLKNSQFLTVILFVTSSLLVNGPGPAWPGSVIGWPPGPVWKQLFSAPCFSLLLPACPK